VRRTEQECFIVLSYWSPISSPIDCMLSSCLSFDVAGTTNGGVFTVPGPKKGGSRIVREIRRVRVEKARKIKNQRRGGENAVVCVEREREETDQTNRVMMMTYASKPQRTMYETDTVRFMGDYEMI